MSIGEDASLGCWSRAWVVAKISGPHYRRLHAPILRSTLYGPPENHEAQEVAKGHGARPNIGKAAWSKVHGFGVFWQDQSY